MTTRQHLRKVHERAAEFHLEAAKSHRALAKCFGKAEGMEESQGDIQAAHEGLAQQHMDMSEFHVECCKSLDQANKAAMGGDDLDRLVPDDVRGVIDPAPVSKAGLRAIPRAGAPPLSVEVPAGFEKFVSLEDDGE